MMSKYPIIVFEGIEASGKSTSLKKIIKYLKKKKIKYVTFREPGGTNFSEKLRSLMLDKKSKLNKKLVPHNGELERKKWLHAQKHEHARNSAWYDAALYRCAVCASRASCEAARGRPRRRQQCHSYH